VMVGEGAVERDAGLGIDRLGEIETGDFGAGVIGQRRDGEGRHGKSSHTVFVRADTEIGNRLSEKIAPRLGRTLSPGTGRVKAPQGRATGFAPAKEAVMVRIGGRSCGPTIKIDACDAG
jgi:hypothetical protein